MPPRRIFSIHGRHSNICHISRTGIILRNISANTSPALYAKIATAKTVAKIIACNTK